LNLDWGLNSRHTYSSASTGAWGFSPVINTHEDIYKIKEPSVRVDERKSDEEYSTACEVLKGVLNVRQKGVTHFSFNIMQVYTGLRGLEQTMWDMVDAPGMLHEAMNIIENGYRRVIEQCMDMKLFSLNNDDSYHGSGGLGYTDELPSQGFNPRLVRPQDMWASAESQELVQVSPEMHEEFAMQYERRLLEPFGLNGYGCCEDLTKKMDYVLSMPKLRRISISPWADVAACSERLGHKYIFSWKPQPSHLVGDIDREMIRRYIHDTVDVVDRRCLEIVLKDTHTCENHPDRFTEWARIARSIIMN
jgi:hypothetical protein